MARIKLSPPDKFFFSADIPIRITDINYGGHVGNDTFLSLIHEARIKFLARYSLTELDFGGTSLIMSDISIEYKKELFYGDCLKVYINVIELTRAGFELFYKMVKNQEETIVAFAKSGMVCYDYASKKIVAVPQNIRLQFQEQL